jgi:GH18 family chitinase
VQQVQPSVTAPAAVTTGHYAGTYYPLYNSGENQWIEPATSMPFEKIGDIFGAFAHSYPKGQGAILAFEQGQPEEFARLNRLERIARGKNPHVKIFITLGWGHHDWDYIAQDEKNNARLFVPSVVEFLRANDLDGFDIDDEGIGRQDTGTITQPAFDRVIVQLRSALNVAAKADKRSYYLVITPAGDNTQPGGIAQTQVDARNVRSFDWINVQSYYQYPDWGEKFITGVRAVRYPATSIAVGVNTEDCLPNFPSYDGLKGIFDWTMSADSNCNFKFTQKIASAVDYQP